MAWNKILNISEGYKARGKDANGNYFRDMPWYWSHRNRDAVEPARWSRGEAAARRNFGKLIVRGLTPLEAARVALRQKHGPPPGVAADDWKAEWTEEKLQDIADRWRNHAFVNAIQRLARIQAHTDAQGASDEAVGILKGIAGSEEVMPRDRIAACKAILEEAGSAEQEVLGDIEELRKRAAKSIEPEAAVKKTEGAEQ